MRHFAHEVFVVFSRLENLRLCTETVILLDFQGAIIVSPEIRHTDDFIFTTVF